MRAPEPRRAGIVSRGLLSNLSFRLFRMLLILTGVVGAMALLFPVIQELNTPSDGRSVPSVLAAPSAPAAP